MVPTTPYECFITALLCASCATLILLDSASVYALLDKCRLYVAGFLRAARAGPPQTPRRRRGRAGLCV